MTAAVILFVVLGFLFGAGVANQQDQNGKWCVAVTCNIDSSDTEGTAGVKLPDREREEEPQK